MKNLSPIKIQRIDDNMLQSQWDDGFTGIIKISVLRNECPCADCKKDDLNNKQKPKFKLEQFKAGKNELKELKFVGNYAVTAVWGDGHDTGIYSWDYFRALFEQFNLNKEK